MSVPAHMAEQMASPQKQDNIWEKQQQKVRMIRPSWPPSVRLQHENRVSALSCQHRGAHLPPLTSSFHRVSYLGRVPAGFHRVVQQPPPAAFAQSHRFVG